MLKRVARLACVTHVNLLVSQLSNNVDGTQASRAPEFGVREVLVVNQDLWWLVGEKKRRRIESLFAAAGAQVGVKSR